MSQYTESSRHQPSDNEGHAGQVQEHRTSAWLEGRILRREAILEAMFLLRRPLFIAWHHPHAQHDILAVENHSFFLFCRFQKQYTFIGKIFR